MSDLPGPEKPLDWVELLKQEMLPRRPSTTMQTSKRVRARHRIAVMLQESGWRTKDIASALGYTQARLSVILNSHHPEIQAIKAGFAAQVADQVLDVQSRFKLYANEMLDIIVGHARNGTTKPELSRLAARDILHMAGFTPVKRQITLEGQIPQAEITKALDKIQEANEVVLNAENWRVKSA